MTIVSLFIIIWAASALLRVSIIESNKQASQVAEGLALSPIFKIAITEHYQMYGKLPESNDEARLPPKEKYAKEALQSAGISKDGVITLVYNEKSGAAGSRIQLVPSVSESTGHISWDCRTSNFPLIQQLAPQCRYINKQK